MCCLLCSTPIHARIPRARSSDSAATSILLELIRQVNGWVNTTKLVITSCGKKEAKSETQTAIFEGANFFLYIYSIYLLFFKIDCIMNDYCSVSFSFSAISFFPSSSTAMDIFLFSHRQSLYGTAHFLPPSLPPSS